MHPHYLLATKRDTITSRNHGREYNPVFDVVNWDTSAGCALMYASTRKQE
jgi:hypothetical protein